MNCLNLIASTNVDFGSKRMEDSMNHAKRLKKSLVKLDKVEEVVKYAMIHTVHEMEYRRYLQDLRNDLEYLSMEKKEHRIRFAKKILSGRLFKRMHMWNRFKFGIKWILTGRI